MRKQYTGTNGKTFTVEVTAEQAEVMIDIDRKFDSNERKFRARATKEASLDYLSDEYEWEPQDNTVDVQQEVEREDEAERVRRAVACLNEKQQLIVRLCYYEGKEHQEVAAILGVSKAAVSQQFKTIYVGL